MAKLQIFHPDGTPATVELSEEKLTIGRLADNGLHIDDGSVSSHHAEVVFEAGVWHLHDLGSTNGTFVNGEQVSDSVLRHGDEIRFGGVDAVFASEELEAEQPPPQSAAVAAETGQISARPSGFLSSSPIPKGKVGKDPLAGVLIAAGVVSLLVFGGAIFLILQMAAPA